MSIRNIPVIDIDDLAERQTLRALDDACRDWGFFQVVNHGIAAEVISSLRREMRVFFSQPTAFKREISRTAENPWGYFDRELTKNTRDWKEIYDYGPADGLSMMPQWPRAMPMFKEAVHAFYDCCEALSFRLLAAVTENLGMPRAHLMSNFSPSHTSFLRLNYYPPCPLPERPEDLSTPKAGHMGLNQHTDSGALTLLLQDDQPGLEVYRHGRWHLVEPRMDALVINVGDMIQVWSNDRYRAALHRVLANAGAERFSAPFFLSPSYETVYAPLPTTVSAAQPAHYHAINWREFRQLRAAGDYADIGEEVQISHYAV